MNTLRILPSMYVAYLYWYCSCLLHVHSLTVIGIWSCDEISFSTWRILTTISGKHLKSMHIWIFEIIILAWRYSIIYWNLFLRLNVLRWVVKIFKLHFSSSVSVMLKPVHARNACSFIDSCYLWYGCCFCALTIYK